MSKAGGRPKPPEKPYGYVLVLRGLARAAIRLEHHPAALRVLCVAADYMNQDAECRVGQATLAARLGISRQAVNRHLALLDEMDILIGAAASDGVTLRYCLDTEGLEDEREGQKRVDAHRAAKRAKAPSQAQKSASDRMARNEHFYEERIGFLHLGAKLDAMGIDEANAAVAAYEASQGVKYVQIEGSDLYRKIYIERQPLAVVAGTDVQPPVIVVGQWVSHHKFGVGRVEDCDAKTVTADFGNGPRKIVAAFVQPCAAPPSQPATPNVAGGAT